MAQRVNNILKMVNKSCFEGINNIFFSQKLFLKSR
jgi:hypothetical protein